VESVAADGIHLPPLPILPRATCEIGQLSGALAARKSKILNSDCGLPKNSDAWMWGKSVAVKALVLAVEAIEGTD